MLVSVRTRLLVGFGFTCAILAVAVSASGLLIGTVDKRTAAIASARLPAAQQSLMMAAHFTASTSAVYRYLLTRDPTDKETLNAEWSSIVEAGDKLDAVSDTFPPEKRAIWKDLMTRFDAIYRLEHELMGSAATEPMFDGRPSPTLQAGLREIEFRVDYILSVLVGEPDGQGTRRGGISGDQSAALVADIGDVHWRLTGLESALYGLLAISLGVSVALAVAITRSVVGPVKALVAAARRIQEGDYTPTSIAAPPEEIGRLASAMSCMATTIGRREEVIRHQASHDATTGLTNRLALEEWIDAELGEKSAALIVVRLTRLQEVVNTVGHHFGDRLVREIGRRLAESAGLSVLGRVSDSGFAVFLESVTEAEVQDRSRALLEIIERPFECVDLTIDPAGACGVAVYPDHGDTATMLLRRAEVASFQAERGESRIATYDPRTDPHRPERLTLMAELRLALQRDELELFYQPKLDLETMRVMGAEALIRWRHPTRGLVPPDLFIGLAEETGNIRRLSQWVLATGIAQAARWHRQGRRLRISLNISARDLADQSLPETVTALLSREGLPADLLMIEITESAIMADPDAAIAVAHRLADADIALSIDDFGIGQSSFAYLRRLPVRELKIDKSFVTHVSSLADDTAIVQSAIGLGHSLGFKVTAEGVEDVVALDVLKGFGCEYAQGYAISRPLDLVAFETFLVESPWQGAVPAGSMD